MASRPKPRLGQTPVKKFCRTCGKRLVLVTKSVTFDEYTGERQTLSQMQCPDLQRHVDEILMEGPWLER